MAWQESAENPKPGKITRNKTQRFSKWFPPDFFLLISAACCQLEDVLLQYLKNTWKLPFPMLFVDIDGALLHPRLLPNGTDLRKRQKREQVIRWRVRSVLSFSRRTFLDHSPSSNDSPLAKCIASIERECPGRLPQAAYPLQSRSCPR